MPDKNLDKDSFGELSQDDIDQLMNSTPANPGKGADDNGDEDDMELISQNDIDRLMNAGLSSDETAEQSSNEKEGAQDDDFGELSQDDIDSLVTVTSDDVSEEPSIDEDMEMISQDDINALMGENYDEADRENETAETENLLIEVEADDQSDELIVVEETAAPAMEDDIPEDDYIIDEADAVNVLDCLITQETLDDLPNRSDNEPTADSDPVILDDEPEQDLEAAPVSDSFFDSNDPGVEEDALLNDAEDLLKLDFNDEEDVTQDDMDTLLLETGDGADDDEEDDDGEDEYDENDAIVISQDDIDTLLMSADQEDEDVLGSLMDDEFDGSLEESFVDEDILESDTFDETTEDQVDFSTDSEEPVEEPEEEKTTGPAWYTSKLVIACVSALIVLGITVPLTYFLFFSGGPQEIFQPDPVESLIVEQQREIEIEIESDGVIVDTPVINQNPGNMILKDFVILAPDLYRETAYLTADISIDYSDERAYHEIFNNLSFYRDLIYQSIGKTLVSETIDNLTQADVLGKVEAAIKKVLPESYIKKVSFTSFKAS